MKIKTVLITGCSSGFGLLLVSAFLKKGWRVFATMRNAEKRKVIFNAELNKFSDRLRVLNFDVTSESDLQEIVQYVREHGELDCLINNAGYGVFSALEDASPKQIREQMNINVTGLMLTTRALLPFLRKSKGHLVNFSSVFGFSVAPLTSLYCSSKYAVEGFTEALYYELLPHGVRVSIVEPGAFATEFKANVVYGEESGSKSSPYYWQSENYKAYTEKMMVHAGHPEVIVKAVIQAVEAKSAPLRIRRGKDAAAVGLAKSLAPGLVFRFLSRLFFGMTINKK